MDGTVESGLPIVAAGGDREGVQRSMGISTLTFKVLAADTAEQLFVVEQTNHRRGGPPRHLHRDQDEWFYVIAGDYIVEVGNKTHHLRPGASILAPRAIPHVWACVGDGQGRVLVAFTPAGHMEAFFREVTKAEAMPPQDPALWHAHGMEVVGPPLETDAVPSID